MAPPSQELEPPANPGRFSLLVTLYLCGNDVLRKPLLYLSLYLKTHRADYYRLLQEVRERGAWEAWLEFFSMASPKPQIRPSTPLPALLTFSNGIGSELPLKVIGPDQHFASTISSSKIRLQP